MQCVLRSILSVQATSIYPERLFSKVSGIISKKRHNLKDDSISAIVYLAANIDWIVLYQKIYYSTINILKNNILVEYKTT